MVEVKTPEDRYFDKRSLEEYSNMSIRTIDRHISAGDFPVYRAGGKILIKKTEFDAFIESRRQIHEPRPVDLRSMLREISDRVIAQRRKAGVA